MKLIQIENLYKKYYINDEKATHRLLINKKKEIVALKNINLEVSAGECIGLIGMNGAGKSTLIKIMIGILQPTAGKIRLFDTIPYKNRKKNNFDIATVFGQRTQLRWDLSIKDSYELIKDIYNVNDRDYIFRLNQVIKELNLKDFFNQPIRTLSLGQKMRAELGSAFLYNAKILFLDEPTIGVDFYSKEAIIQFIKRIKNQGTTIILTSHDIDDIKELCERVVVMDKGEIIVDTHVENLHLNEERTIIMELKNIECIDCSKINNYETDNNRIIIHDVNESDLQLIISSVEGIENIKSLSFEGKSLKDFLKEVYIKYGN